MKTLIDHFELTEPVVETYRDSYRACVVTPLEYRSEPLESMDCSIDFEDPTRRFPTPSSHASHVSERRSRARLWGTED